MATAKKTTKTVPADNDRAMGKVYKVKKPFPTGVRADFMKAIPKGGAPLADIVKKAGVEPKKALGYARWLAANGFLSRE